MPSASSFLLCVACTLLLPIITTLDSSPDVPHESSGGQDFWRDLPSYTESYEDHDLDGDHHLDSEIFFDHNRHGGFTSPPTSTPAEPRPQFLEGEEGNVTAQLGGRVILNCGVEQLGDKTVSWVRRHGDDLILLTAGRLTVASDGRWSLQASPPTDWKLSLRPVAARDQGSYECQVSTHPPMVRKVSLHVLVPKVEIVDERGVSVSDKFYKEGSIIELRCVITRLPQPGGQVAWVHQGRRLDYDGSKGGISVKTEVVNSGALSRLYIANASKKDSGNYTCSLEDVSATTVAVHVLRGENPLAMQRGSSSVFLPSILLLVILTTS